jgi:predicted GNAT family N-acyltransferase
MDFRLRIATWKDLGAGARAVRQAVFVEEQKVPAHLEWDDHDDDCVQLLATDADGNAIGTGRLLADGAIGRIAILAPHRGQGLGRAIMEALIAEARRRGLTEVYLTAQTQAMAFYEKLGFTLAGGEFLEAGIPHITMKRRFD